MNDTLGKPYQRGERVSELEDGNTKMYQVEEERELRVFKSEGILREL